MTQTKMLYSPGKYRYSVDFNIKSETDRGSTSRFDAVRRRNDAMMWCEEQNIDYDWRLGEVMYRFYFLTEEDATMFKLAWGV